MTACDRTDFEYRPARDGADAAARERYWATAIGLQQVDGLKPSAYLEQLAERHIENTMSLAETGAALRVYYRRRAAEGESLDVLEREADFVSQRIAEMLSADTFAFMPDMLAVIHKTLFQDLPHETYRPGQFKTENLVKPETVLNGDSVVYGDPLFLEAFLRHLFDKEEGYYYGVSLDEGEIEHFAHFISSLWQVHPFWEGNTRTIAVFAELYLRNLGFDVSNEPFSRHARCFRDALVRANYRNAKAQVMPEISHLVKFFENMLCGTRHPLRSRELFCMPLFGDPALLRNMPPSEALCDR